MLPPSEFNEPTFSPPERFRPQFTESSKNSTHLAPFLYSSSLLPTQPHSTLVDSRGRGTGCIVLSPAWFPVLKKPVAELHACLQLSLTQSREMSLNSSSPKQVQPMQRALLLRAGSEQWRPHSNHSVFRVSLIGFPRRALNLRHRKRMSPEGNSSVWPHPYRYMTEAFSDFVYFRA